MSHSEHRASGLPVKRFFIDILVRDIELQPAILDLVDNSIDSAREMRGQGALDGLRIELSVSGEEFRIEDNCAGIPLEIAEKYAFRFGRHDQAPETPGSVGQFGVGMKRALFKLGKRFEVLSSTTDAIFSVATSVPEWEDDEDNWDFPIDLVNADSNPARSTGTMIIVTELHEAVAETLNRETTISELREQLRIRHRESLARGLKIVLNGVDIEAADVSIIHSDEIGPVVSELTIPTPDGIVHVRLIVGVGPPATKDPDTPPEDVKEAERRAGWYVFCNDRLLLNADRTVVTGWGAYDGLPLFHNQFARFRGFAYLEAENAAALPWNTSKTGVDSDSPVWKRARAAMIDAGRPVVKLLNDLKNETGSSLPASSRPVTRALAEAQSIPISSYRTADPREITRPAPAKIPKRTNRKRISFGVEPDRFRRVSEYLKEKDGTKIGEHIFEYFYERQITDD